MRFLLKTSPAQDIRLFQHGGQVSWYGALCGLLLICPWLLDEYWLSQLTFVLLYGVAGLGLMLMAGFTGLMSLGHAAFFGVGAYAQAYLINKGVPFPVALLSATVLSAAVGVIVGLPSLRVKGIYLAIATVAFAFIVEEVFARWESVTGGNAGLHVRPPMMFGYRLDSGRAFYFTCLASAALATLAVLNLLRSTTGRAFIALRDSEISARSMGIQAARYKAYAFAFGAGLAGWGGALYTHKLKFISPDQFTISQSIEFLLMVVVGGLGSIQGAFLGAGFLIALPQMISLAKDYFPGQITNAPGLQMAIYGIILVLFVLFEPNGIFGRWLKIKSYFDVFPFYRRGAHRRQKSFQKSEHLK